MIVPSEFIQEFIRTAYVVMNPVLLFSFRLVSIETETRVVIVPREFVNEFGRVNSFMEEL